MLKKERNLEIVEKIRSSLQARRYDDFVDLFTTDSVYELPFALSGSVSKYEGISVIRDRFNEISKSPVNRLYDLVKVNAVIHQTVDPNVVVIELSIEGKLLSNSKPIEIQSSVAIVSFEGDKIKRYRDYPNSAGIAEATGVLAQYAASIVK